LSWADTGGEEAAAEGEEEEVEAVAVAPWLTTEERARLVVSTRRMKASS